MTLGTQPPGGALAERMHDMGARARAASRALGLLSADDRTRGLTAIAAAIRAAAPEILAANEADMAAANAKGLAPSMLDWYWLSLLPMFVIFFVSALAETNRPPFDLVEAESELVAGFMVEYSSTPYLLFMLGEYVAIVTMCALMTILFLGGWLPPVAVAPS